MACSHTFFFFLSLETDLEESVQLFLPSDCEINTESCTRFVGLRVEDK
jgi:hypothetical protein